MTPARSDEKKQDEGPEQGDGDETVNDPLTQRDVEAPRAEFEGRRPEE